MKHYTTNFGGGLLPYLRPELEVTEIAVESGFAASQAIPGGLAKPLSLDEYSGQMLDSYGDQAFDSYGDAFEEQ